MKISFVGAGNVAFRMSLAMVEKGYDVYRIFNRNIRHRDKLVSALRKNGSTVAAAEGVSELFDSDVVVIAVTDGAIEGIVNRIADALGGLREKVSLSAGAAADSKTMPIFVHTSGATSIDVFAPLTEMGCNCGVLYPLMTLNRGKNVEFVDVPLLLEATSEATGEVLDTIATTLGGEHYFYSSEARLRMHVAAVFTCNFVNYLLGMAFPIVQHDHPLLLPSTLEAVRNAFLKTPAEALTGPAKRGDMETIEKHLALLEKAGLKEQAEIYRSFTEKILDKYTKL